jgi:Rieske Fe-S protein
MQPDGFTRREALTTLTVGATLAAGACAGLGGCAAEKKNKGLITSGVVSLGPAADYPAGSASTRFMDTYGLVVVNESGTVLAVRPKCTHQGCIAPYVQKTDQFECPCHGSRFDKLGRPLKGPATRPLPAVRTERTADGLLAVDLSKLYAL